MKIQDKRIMHFERYASLFRKRWFGECFQKWPLKQNILKFSSFCLKFNFEIPSKIPKEFGEKS